MGNEEMDGDDDKVIPAVRQKLSLILQRKQEQISTRPSSLNFSILNTTIVYPFEVQVSAVQALLNLSAGKVMHLLPVTEWFRSLNREG